MTTAIASLPNEVSQENIVMDVKEKKQPNVSQFVEKPPNTPQPQQNGPAVRYGQPPPAELSKESINQIVQSLNDARGDTGLHARDIQPNMEQFSHDQQIRPNYVPESHVQDYIHEEESVADLIRRQQQDSKQKSRLEILYEEAQTPILIMLLYFLFQLPFFKNILKNKMPGLFLKDGNYTFGGYLLHTVIFGFTYYGLTKSFDYLTEIY